MTPYYEDPMVMLYQGDVRAVLRELPERSANMCVTSPPYWSLRDYGIEPSVWGGVTGCEHEWVDSSWRDSRRGEHEDDCTSAKQATNAGTVGHRGEIRVCGICACCGAWKGALGLEPTPEMFVAHMVEVFREVRRVLRDDGTLWLNLGDSYAGSWGAQSRGAEDDSSTIEGTNPIARGQIAAAARLGTRTGARGIATTTSQRRDNAEVPRTDTRVAGLKPKDMVGVPWRVAFALQADGWWLRDAIIWHKPNPMPESTRDRCTKSYEHVFLLAKSARYYYDADAIREDGEGYGRGTGPGGFRSARYQNGVSHDNDAAVAPNGAHGHSFDGGRNKRNVWTIPTAPYAKAHFATFPPALVEPCVLAGCPEGGVVLEPFAGSGTTNMVAKRLGRRSIGIDLNPAYLAMAVERAQAVSLPFVGAS